MSRSRRAGPHLQPLSLPPYFPPPLPARPPPSQLVYSSIVARCKVTVGQVWHYLPTLKLLPTLNILPSTSQNYNCHYLFYILRKLKIRSRQYVINKMVLPKQSSLNRYKKAEMLKSRDQYRNSLKAIIKSENADKCKRSKKSKIQRSKDLRDRYLRSSITGDIQSYCLWLRQKTPMLCDRQMNRHQ